MNEGEKYKEITKLRFEYDGVVDNHYRNVEVRFNPYSSTMALWDLDTGGFSPIYEQTKLEPLFRTETEDIQYGIEIIYKKLDE
jgi:hypothetical protein